MVKYFIDKGFDINSFSKNGNFPIERAVWISDLDTIKFLVEKLGAKINVGKPLSEACSRNRTELIQYLVSNGANVNEFSEYLPNPIEYAIKFGNIEVIKYLVENEVKVDDQVILRATDSLLSHILKYLKAYKSLSMIHFHGREEEYELIKNANINCFFNEVNLKTNCELYRKYYHIDKPWIIHPFVFAERFQNRKPFNERKNMAFATGTITYKVHKEFLDTYGDSCDQPSRKQIKDNPEFLKDTVYCTSSDYLEDNAGKPIKDNDFVLIKLYKKIYNRLFTGKQKKYFSFDMVEAFNSYKMCIVGEEILGIPGIGFVEGMACGCAYIGIDSPAYRDWGLVPGIHYITYDGTKEDLKRVIEYYQMDEHQEELERIARTGYDYVRTHFNGDAVAETLLHDLEEQQRIWLAQKG